MPVPGACTSQVTQSSIAAWLVVPSGAPVQPLLCDEPSKVGVPTPY
jgi:hypothetical protein